MTTAEPFSSSVDGLPSISLAIHHVLAGACVAARKRRALSVSVPDLFASLAWIWRDVGDLFESPEHARSLVTESPGRARRPVSEAYTVEAWGATRQARWGAFGPQPPAWDEAAVEVVEAALGHAAEDDLPWAASRHLLRAVLAECRDANRLSLQQRRSLGALQTLASGSTAQPRDMRPPINPVDFLATWGYVSVPGRRRAAPWRSKAQGFLSGVTAGASPILATVEKEAVIRAVRLDAPHVSNAHLVLAVASFEEQMRVAAAVLEDRFRYASRPLLLDRGFSVRGASVTAHAILTAAGRPALASRQRARAWRSDRRNPPWTRPAARSAEQARRLSMHGRGIGGSHHLLHAALSDTDDSGRRLLAVSGIDADDILNEISAPSPPT